PTRSPGYYPGFSTLSQSPFWDSATRDIVEMRVDDPPKRRFFTEEEWDFWTAVFAHLIPQTDRTIDRQIPLVAPLDDRLYQNRTVGYRYEDMPQDRVVYRIGIQAIDAESQKRFGGGFLLLPQRQQELVLQGIQQGKPAAGKEIWRQMSVKRFWQMMMTDAIEAYYAHPWAWDEIGFGGPAYPRAYTRLERGEPEPWEKEEKRYEWLAPPFSVSDIVDGSDTDDSQAHHGSGGTH
ncbi:MAG: gluconate 2-dehydrogenase subunit 3 family protein, partial [Acidobacteriaceae bacterium]